MTAAEVLHGVPLATPLPPQLASVEVAGLDYDSRRIGPGFLFFAFPGHRFDGRRFAPEALRRGAFAVVSESPPPADFSGPWIQVAHGRRALALAAGNFYRHPDRRLTLVGVTGTNGKTTTCFLLDSMFQAAGFRTALIGTIEYRLAGEILPAVNTTPESLDVLRLFDQLLRRGGAHATMEVSSHALALGRVYGFQFHTAVFTNLTQDHLDFHRDMEDYFAAKRLLFEGAGAPAPRCAAVNADDPYARRLPLDGIREVFSYGLSSEAAVRARNVTADFQGLRFEICTGGRCYPVRSPLPGRINVYNILAAWCAGLACGLSPDVMTRGIAACTSVPGRFEKVDQGQPFLVIVDYAHTDAALRNLITVARELGPRRILTLFGCGGDRDRSKRPLMGQAAAELSDFVVVTSDNPRSEDPEAIIADALIGVRRCATPFRVEPDRAAAIRLVLSQAGPGDIVLIAGKGHETYQVLKDRVIPFDDREVARRVLRELGYPGDER